MEKESQQSPRSAGQALAGSRPFIGATVHYTAVGGDGLHNGRTYAATITALDRDDGRVSLHVMAPNAQLDIEHVSYSASSSPAERVGCWSWPGIVTG